MGYPLLLLFSPAAAARPRGALAPPAGHVGAELAVAPLLAAARALREAELGLEVPIVEGVVGLRPGLGVGVGLGLGLGLGVGVGVGLASQRRRGSGLGAGSAASRRGALSGADAERCRRSSVHGSQINLRKSRSLCSPTLALTLTLTLTPNP